MTVFDTADLAVIEDTAKRFAQAEICPHLEAREEAGEFPRGLYRKLADMGWLGLGYPEELGGTPAPWAVRVALSRTLSRYTGSGGVMAGAFSHSIGLPPILNHGSDELKRRVIPDVLAGSKVSALGITEPGCGSDVSRLRTTARREGGDYVVDGEKVFITSGMRADWITAAVRTDPDNKGASGISMLVIPGDAPGLSRAPLRKMGWLCSDTAHLHFDGVRVPAGNLVGEEGKGFRIIMTNFNGERLSMAAMALGMSECCYDEALAWARERKTFGASLVNHQVVRHKLVDMRMRIESTRAWLTNVADRADAGQADAQWIAEVCMLKNHATQAMQFCADQAVQILGGMGYMRGTASERIYREVKVATIGGGTEEIMKELASRQLGI
ncbi:MAG: acyl-CoA dehydrogenase family protein [Steroidobacteraceae bacterium]|nr:acyl-CoA dehydrogenase family protein [Steroidobacteraceae bacterium]